MSNAASGAPLRSIVLSKVYDSRGNPTVLAEVSAEGSISGRASCPSGASTGAHEVEAFPGGLPDTGIANARSRLIPHLLHLKLGDQAQFDRALEEIDGTDNFALLGGNTTTAISMAYARASAAGEGLELWEYVSREVGSGGRGTPGIVGNVMNGGVHAIGGPDIQEFIAFVKAPEVRTEVEVAFAVHRNVGRRLRRLFPNAALGRGDEGGWVAPLSSEEALQLLSEACLEVTDSLGGRDVVVRPGLDLAATELYRAGAYHYKERRCSPEQQLDLVGKLINDYDLAYVEDPFEEEDYGHFGALTRMSGSRNTLIVGDDIYTTSPERVERGISEKTSNAVLVKVNQVGTLSLAVETVKRARAASWDTITSHRSGETTDDWLSHLAVAFGSAGIKCGVMGGERVAKLNELVRIGEVPMNDG